MTIFKTLQGRESCRCYLARIDGEAAGGGVCMIHERLGGLFGTSTLPDYRGRGCQSALIIARLEEMKRQECDMAMAVTLPGIQSQRNLESFGFRVVYTKAQMIKEFE